MMKVIERQTDGDPNQGHHKIGSHARGREESPNDYGWVPVKHYQGLPGHDIPAPLTSEVEKMGQGVGEHPLDVRGNLVRAFARGPARFVKLLGEAIGVAFCLVLQSGLELAAHHYKASGRVD